MSKFYTKALEQNNFAQVQYHEVKSLILFVTFQ